MTDPKYQCLVEATANSGVALPPIADGGTVREVRGTLAAPAASVHFEYPRPDGQMEHVLAGEGEGSINNGPLEIMTRFATGHRPPNSRIIDYLPESYAISGPKGGEDLSPGVKPNTTPETTHRILKCLDPLVS